MATVISSSGSGLRSSAVAGAACSAGGGRASVPLRAARRSAEAATASFCDFSGLLAAAGWVAGSCRGSRRCGRHRRRNRSHSRRRCSRRECGNHRCRSRRRLRRRCGCRLLRCRRRGVRLRTAAAQLERERDHRGRGQACDPRKLAASLDRLAIAHARERDRRVRRRRRTNRHARGRLELRRRLGRRLGRCGERGFRQRRRYRFALLARGDGRRRGRAQVLHLVLRRDLGSS